MNWLYNLKTQRKLLILNILVALNLAWISGAALLRMGNINKAVKSMYNEQLRAVSSLRTIGGEVAQLDSIRQMIVGAPSAALRVQHQEEFGASAKELQESVAEAQEILESTKDGEKFKETAAALLTWLEDATNLVERMVAGDKSAFAVAESMNSNTLSLEESLEAMAEAKEKEAETAFRDAEEMYRGTFSGQIWIMVIGVVINVLMGIFIASLITKPLSVIAQTTDKMAEGDLTQQAKVNSKDEIGAMAKTLNRALENLRGLIKQVSKTAEQVASSSEELAASSSETGKTTSQVAATVEQLAKGTEEQAKSATTADDTVQHMTTLLNGMSEKLRAMVEDSSRASSLASNGRASVSKAIGQMTSIRDTVEDSAEAVKGLGERSREIGQIVDVITGIADQTNLLALNAAIEAARAGEQGRGFAVVAEEVRKLAEQSRQAAERISGLIREIQGETGKAVATMEAGTKEVAAGTAVINDTGAVFAQIAEAVETVVNQINEVSQAAQQVVAGSEQVVQAVESIANITEQAAASAEEVSASAEEQTASVQEIAASADSLARMAQELQHEVSKFTV